MFLKYLSEKGPWYLYPFGFMLFEDLMIYFPVVILGNLEKPLCRPKNSGGHGLPLLGW